MQAFEFRPGYDVWIYVRKSLTSSLSKDGHRLINDSQVLTQKSEKLDLAHSVMGP